MFADYSSRYERLLFSSPETGVVLVTMDRPDAMDARLSGELSRVWLDLNTDEDCRAVVLTGSDVCFCIPGDLKGLQPTIGDFGFTARTMKNSYDLIYNMMNLRQPLVSAVSGNATGMGLALALLADISIVAEDAILADGHIQTGLPAGDHSVLVWPLLCSMAKAKYYLLAAKSLDGREAERIGLASQCVPAGQVLGDALALASSLAAGPPWATQWTKRALNNWLRSAGPLFDASLAWEFLGFHSPERLEAANAAAQDRPPDYRACPSP